MILISLCSAITVCIVFALFMRGGIRASGSDIVMIFPLLYYFLTGRTLISFFLFIVVLLGGKVGPLFSLVIVMLIYFGSVLSLRSIIFFLILTFLSLIALFTFDFESWSQYIPFLGKFSIVFDGLIRYGNADFIDRFLLGGRLSEVLGAMTVYSNQPELMLTGPGTGYVYDLYVNGVLDSTNHHGVHFSPVSIFTIYGGLYFFVFYSYMLYLSFKSIGYFRNRNSTLKMLAAGFFLGNLFNSFTAYSIFSLLLFPMVMGYYKIKYLQIERKFKSELLRYYFKCLFPIFIFN